MSVEINIESNGELHCTAVHLPSGQRLVTDVPVDNGGKGEAFSPTDLVATALGTCMTSVMDLVARRHQIDIKGTKVTVLKEMVAAPLRRIGELKVRIEFPKELHLATEQQKLLERAAATCAVKQSLHPDILITTEFVYA